MSDPDLDEGGLFALTDPVGVARLFSRALMTDDIAAVMVLEQLVAPETRDQWGDFTEVARSWREAGFFGINTGVTYARGDRTVAYVPMLDKEDMDPSREAGPAIVLGVINLVWREDLNRWAVFALAEMMPPEKAPRGPRQ